jgi:NAD(P)H-dependent flavin oxidoreductase YrpB (nitropropane dioxygenase family)
MTPQRDLIVGVTPLGRPDPKLAIALARAGALGVLDLGTDRKLGLEALTALQASGEAGFGVAVSREASFQAKDLPNCVDTVVLEAGTPVKPWADRRVVVQCISLAEALDAATNGAHGIIAKGSESGGRVGDESAFVLLQRLVPAVDLPVWVQGGIGTHTAGACIAGGAQGVVLDTQLALLAESSLDEQTRATIASLDGSETSIIDGHRQLTRPGPVPDAIAGSEDPALRGVVSLGQDAAFARTIAGRYQSIPRFVKALQASIADALVAARDEAPLQVHAPFAEQHGLRYPIAQGPMTRVSDTTEFAAAVAGVSKL